MNMSFEDLVRERAYHLWIAGGMADGREHEHWAMAEQAVKADVPPVVILTKPATARAAKATVVKTAATKAKPAAKRVSKKAKAEVAAVV